MVQSVPEYRAIDTRSQWEKIITIATSVFLILLVPTTALGYVSESSLPGQTLYPMKRGIEAAVLLVESLTPYGKALYYQTLATKRVDEAGIVIAQAATTSDLANPAATSFALQSIVTTVQQAQTTANSIQDPVQKQKARQQLATAIQKYQSQLSNADTTVRERTITTQQTPPAAGNDNSSPTTTPDSTASTTTTDTTLQDQIQQTQEDLQTISSQLQDATQEETTAATPSSTPFPERRDGKDNAQQQDNTRHQTDN